MNMKKRERSHHVPSRLAAASSAACGLARVAALLVALAGTFGAAGEAAAGEAAAHCNAALLCPGTGACSINVTTAPNNKIVNGCVLIFDGRDVILNGTLDIAGGAVTIRARNFTVASGGLIDGSPQGGFITVVAGGNILVQSSNQKGIDVIGQDQGGAIVLDATGNVTVDGRLKANNSSSATDASGGSIELHAGGNLRISGSSDVDASGGRFADGGSVDFLAVGRIDIEKDVLVSGGEGGDANLEAGDEILLNGRLIDDSTGGGGGGGFVDILAGKTITVGKSIRSVGSTSIDPFGGDGGFLAITSNRGDVIVRDEITVQSGGPDGGGGEIELSAGRSVKHQAGRLNARGEGIESFAGTIFLDGDLDVTIGALIDSSGGSEGGEIEIAAGRNVEIANTLDVRARQPATFSGSVIVDAGILEGGAVTVKAAANQAQAGRILATGAGCLEGAFCSIAGTVDLNGCDVTVQRATSAASIAALVDASAPAGADGAGGGIVIVARRLLTVGGTLNATGTGSDGAVELVFPKSRQPILGTSTITPPPASTECTEANCPESTCPPGDAVCRACRPLCLDFCDCGDAERDEFEQCDTSAQGCDTGAGEVCGVTGTFRECICIATCGDGDIDVGEECDGAQNGSTCRGLGFVNSDPVPCMSCAFDTSQCTAGTCGDGVLAPRNELDEKNLLGFFEVCDGTDVGAESCVSLGFTRGTLACKADCSGFNVGGCQIGVCGDNVVDAGEECDAGNANSNAPNAPCRPSCMLPRCGDRIVDTALGEECDDANKNDNDQCLNGCLRARCGDGILCSASTCTTGPTGGPEQCDAEATCCLSTCARRVCPDAIQCGNMGDNGCCHPDKSCNDGDSCTTDQCSPFSGCTHTSRAPCCRTAAECGDGNPCTTDLCNQGTFLCEHTPNASACDDGNACTSGDVCGGGACSGIPNTAPCNDGNACTSGDVCGGGACSGTANTAPCNDSNACTTGDVCAGGTCGGTTVTCVAPDECQEVVGCNPATGCQFRPIVGCCAADGIPCDDGNVCTANDTCDGAACAGMAIDCVSDNPCQEPAGCDPVTGCEFRAIPGCCTENGDCADDDACTNERCDTATHECVSEDVECVTTDECLEVTGCDPVTGCEFRAIPGCCTENGDCADDDACTNERCHTATHQCMSERVQCATTGDECFETTCDPQAGCQAARVNGTVGLGCLMDLELLTLTEEVLPAKEPELGSKLVKQLSKFLKKATKKIEKGRQLAGDPKKAAKAAKQLKAADKQFAKFLKKLESVDPLVAGSLVDLVQFIRDQLALALS